MTKNNPSPPIPKKIIHIEAFPKLSRKFRKDSSSGFVIYIFSSIQ